MSAFFPFEVIATDQLVDGFLDTLTSSVDNVTTVVLRDLEQVFHKATETRQVGGDVWNTHDGTFCRSVAERLV